MESEFLALCARLRVVALPAMCGYAPVAYLPKDKVVQFCDICRRNNLTVGIVPEEEDHLGTRVVLMKKVHSPPSAQEMRIAVDDLADDLSACQTKEEELVLLNIIRVGFLEYRYLCLRRN